MSSSCLCCEELRRALGLLERIDARLARMDVADDVSHPSDARVRELMRLEILLVDRDPGERAAVIMQRMGLSRSAYYRLKIKAGSLASPASSPEIGTPRGTRARHSRTP